jgi:chain length determinant protein EpsF
MNFAQLLLIMIARKRIILFTLVLTILATTLVSFLLPKTYMASTSVLLNYKGVDPLTGMTMPGSLMPGYLATQIDIITSKNVALRVVERLGLAKSPAVIEQFRDATDGKGNINDWLAGLLLKKVDISPSKESSVLEINFKGADPQFVAAVSNAFAEEYQQVSVQLKVGPAQKATAYFTQQTKQLRDAVEAAQSRLSKYQQENGIVSVDNRLDVESNRLNDLSAQLVAAQGQLAEAQSRRRMAQSNSESPDVAASPLVQQLRVSLAMAEGKLADVGQRLDRNHPQYLGAKAEVDKLRASPNRMPNSFCIRKTRSALSGVILPASSNKPPILESPLRG